MRPPRHFAAGDGGSSRCNSARGQCAPQAQPARHALAGPRKAAMLPDVVAVFRQDLSDLGRFPIPGAVPSLRPRRASNCR